MHPAKKNKAGQSWREAKAIIDKHNLEMAWGTRTAVAAIELLVHRSGHVRRRVKPHTSVNDSAQRSEA